jgi:23S rRNA (guanosine2251-2'-O)-methyltransferase
MVVLLHNIRSLHNVGSIFRTADGAGVEKLYLCGITPGPLNRFGEVVNDVKKTALGAEATVAWDGSARSPLAVSKLLEKLKKDGYKIVALEQDKRATLYTRFRPNKKEKIALILGAEVEGLPKTILNKCDTIIEIPMAGKKESLNVSVAFGIAVFHLTNAQ